MGVTEIYKLVPHTAFHFGLRGVGVEATESFCPADTLFSALCLSLRQWEPNGNQALEDWLAGFPPLNGGAPPPMRLSSAFPYAGEVLFFPKPMMPANLPPEMQQTLTKTLKKVAFVSAGILRAWLTHEDLSGEVRKEQLLHRGKVWVTRAEREKLRALLDKGSGRMWATPNVPRVTVDRATSCSTVYQAGVLRFVPGAGLFVLVEFPKDAQAERTRLTTLLQVLGDSGLGGERSSGYGQFRPRDPEPFAGFGSTDDSHFLTLSPYHPTQAEVKVGVLNDGAAYELQTRRGWVGSPEGSNLRRRHVRVLGEGSVLPRVKSGEQDTYGDLVDVTPLDEKNQPMLTHTVWRYGIAFPVPVSMPLNEGEGEEDN